MPSSIASASSHVPMPPEVADGRHASGRGASRRSHGLDRREHRRRAHRSASPAKSPCAVEIEVDVAVHQPRRQRATRAVDARAARASRGARACGPTHAIRSPSTSTPWRRRTRARRTASRRRRRYGPSSAHPWRHDDSEPSSVAHQLRAGQHRDDDRGAIRPGDQAVHRADRHHDRIAGRELERLLVDVELPPPAATVNTSR